MATFKTDPTTGRTVISSDNQVQTTAQGGDDQFEYRQDAANLGLRPGRERMLNVISSQQPVKPGYMNFNEFRAVKGMTNTNPYGNDGFFSRVLGIDPRKIDYTSNLGQQGIANISRVAYDRFLNPFAKVSSVTGRPVGGDAATGTPRYGISPGEQTIAGIAREVPRTGLDALVSGIPFLGGVASMFGNRPTRITSMEDYEQQQQALGMGADLYRKPTQFNNLTPEPIPVGKEVASELPTSISEPYEEAVGATPEDSGTIIVDGKIYSRNEFEPQYSIKGTTPEEQAYLREIRQDDFPTSQGVYPSDRAMIDPPLASETVPGSGMGTFATGFGESRPDIRTVNLEDLSTDQLIEIIESQNSGTPVEENPAPVYEGGIAFPGSLPGATMTLNPPGADVGAPVEIIPPVSDVISGAAQNQFPNLPNYVPPSGGMPFDLIANINRRGG